MFNGVWKDENDEKKIESISCDSFKQSSYIYLSTFHKYIYLSISTYTYFFVCALLLREIERMHLRTHKYNHNHLHQLFLIICEKTGSEAVESCWQYILCEISCFYLSERVLITFVDGVHGWLEIMVLL